MARPMNGGGSGGIQGLHPGGAYDGGMGMGLGGDRLLGGSSFALNRATSSGGAPAGGSRVAGSRSTAVRQGALLNALPSVALTRRFLALCEDHGSERLAVRLIAVDGAQECRGCLPATTGRRGTPTSCGRRSADVGDAEETAGTGRSDVGPQAALAGCGKQRRRLAGGQRQPGQENMADAAVARRRGSGRRGSMGLVQPAIAAAGGLQGELRDGGQQRHQPWQRARSTTTGPGEGTPPELE